MITLSSIIANMIIAASLVLMVTAELKYLPLFFPIIMQAKLIQKIENCLRRNLSGILVISLMQRTQNPKPLKRGKLTGDHGA